MRFSTFMLSYKKKHKQLKSTITFRKLPFYQKIIVIIGFLMIIIGCCFKIAKCELAFGITLLIGSIFIIIFLHKSLSDTRDLSVLIQNSKEYSTDRMNILLDLFKENNLPITTQKIDLLIDEANQAKQDANLFLPLKKPVKALSVLIVPITIYIIQQLFTSYNLGASNAILLLVYCIFIFVAVYTLIPFIEGIMYGIYDDLIYDLRQLKIFYVKEK